MGTNGYEEQSCLNCLFQTGIYIWSNLESECDVVERALCSAKLNSCWNAFPDFVCNDGIIEHFEVTSTKQTRKGSKMRMQQSSMQREMEMFCFGKMNDTQMESISGLMFSKSVKRKTEMASHEFLLQSFEKQWMEHLRKFEAYVIKNGQQEFSAFMVDLRYENLLFMCEDIPINKQLSDNLQPIHQPYWPLADKMLLHRLADYAGDIKYVLFVKQNRCDVVPIVLLRTIADNIIYPFYIYPCSGIVCNYGTYIRLS